MGIKIKENVIQSSFNCFFIFKGNSIIFLFVGKDKTILNSEVVQTLTRNYIMSVTVNLAYFVVFEENDMTV